jgi:cephalosporin-C deacetylase-like acetyl esterase
VFSDLSGQDLWDYRSSQEIPSDFDAFWIETLTEAGSHEHGLEMTPFETPRVTLDVYSQAESHNTSGGPRGTRTHNLRIKSPQLCLVELEAR